MEIVIYKLQVSTERRGKQIAGCMSYIYIVIAGHSIEIDAEDIAHGRKG